MAVAFELVAALALGLVFGAFAWGLRRITGERLPKWITPAAAGIAMIGYAAQADYTWGPRTVAGLPEGYAVVSTVPGSFILKPWTLVANYTRRIAAVDVAGARTNPDAPGMVLTDLLLFDRTAPLQRVPVLVDCAQGRRADIPPGAGFDADGMPEVAGWTDLPPDDPLREALCPPG